MDLFRKYSFLIVAFLLAASSIFGNAMSFLLILLTVVNVCGDGQTFLRNVKRERIYMGLPLAYCIYMLLHFFVGRVLLHDQTRASFSVFETMLLYFVTVPLYVLSMKPDMTKKLLKKSLLAFGWGVFLFNVWLFFRQTGTGIFTQPAQTLGEMYLTRFGDNKTDLLGSFTLMLEPQSMMLALAAIGTLFLTLTQRKISSALLTLGLLLFLSFTLTRSAISAFVIGGGLFGGIYILRRMPLRFRLGALTGVIAIVLLLVYFSPEGIRIRTHNTTEEIGNMMQGDMGGNSLAPRIEMWRCVFGHFDQFALFGRGLFYGADVQEWFTTLPDTVVHRANTHNSFIQYWIEGGLFGLLLLGALFVFPIVRMHRLRRWSLLICGSVTAIFLTNLTCVLFLHVNSLAVMIFWLAAYAFYTRDFIALEQGDRPDSDLHIPCK